MSHHSYSPYYGAQPPGTYYRPRHPSGGGSAVPAGAQPPHTPPTPPSGKLPYLGAPLSPGTVPPPRPHTAAPPGYSHFATPPPPSHPPHQSRHPHYPYSPPSAGYPYPYDPSHASNGPTNGPSKGPPNGLEVPTGHPPSHAPLSNAQAIARAADTVPWIASQLPNFEGISPETRDEIIQKVLNTILSQQHNQYYQHHYQNGSPGADGEEEDRRSDKSGSGIVAAGGGAAPPIMPGGFSSSPTNELPPSGAPGYLNDVKAKAQLPAPPVNSSMQPPKRPAKLMDSPKTGGKAKPKVEAGGGAAADVDSIHGKMWGGYLFEQRPGAPPIAKSKLQSLLRGVAGYIIKNIAPKESIVIPPEKMMKFYESCKIDSEPHNWNTFFTSFQPANLSELYQSLGCHHFLIPPVPSSPSTPCSEAPSLPALTPSGFERWMTIQILAYPERESKRLQKLCMDLPLHDGDKNERFPKLLPRGCLPAKSDSHMEHLWDDSVMSVQRVGYIEGGEDVDFLYGSRERRPYAKSNVDSSKGSDVDERERENYVPPSLLRKKTDQKYATTHIPFDDLRGDPTVNDPIERQRKPYVTIPSGKGVREVFNTNTRPGGGAGIPQNSHGAERPSSHGTNGSGGSGSGGYVSTPYSPTPSNSNTHASGSSSRPGGGGVGLGSAHGGGGHEHHPYGHRHNPSVNTSGQDDELRAAKAKERQLQEEIERLVRRMGPTTSSAGTPNPAASPPTPLSGGRGYPSPGTGYTPISPHSGHYPNLDLPHPSGFSPAPAPPRMPNESRGRLAEPSSGRRRASSISAAEAAAEYFPHERSRDYDKDRLEYHPGRHQHHGSRHENERHYRERGDRESEGGGRDGREAGGRIRHHHRSGSGVGFPPDDMEEEAEGYYRGHGGGGGMYGGASKSRPSSEYGYQGRF